MAAAAGMLCAASQTEVPLFGGPPQDSRQPPALRPGMPSRPGRLALYGVQDKPGARRLPSCLDTRDRSVPSRKKPRPSSSTQNLFIAYRQAPATIGKANMPNATHWSTSIKILHWLTAVLIIAMLTAGLIMTDLPKGETRSNIFFIHMSTGMLVLLLSVLHIPLAVAQGRPPFPLGMKSWERAAAYSVHGALYLLLLLTPLAGWLMASSAGFQAPFYSLFKFPQLIAKSHDVHEIFEEVHSTLAWAILILASVHVLAALKHHFFERDDTLRRMLPASRA